MLTTYILTGEDKMNNIEWKEGAVFYANGFSWFSEMDYSDDVINIRDFQLNEPRQGDYIPKSELDTEQKYNDAVEVFGLFGFKCFATDFDLETYGNLYAEEENEVHACTDESTCKLRKLTYNQLIAIGKLKRLMNERDIKQSVKSKINAELDKPVNSELKDGDKYIRTIYGLCGTPVKVDVYRVLDAFQSSSASIDHAVKKMLCAGLRGHKDKLTDIDNAIESLQAARLLLIQKDRDDTN